MRGAVEVGPTRFVSSRGGTTAETAIIVDGRSYPMRVRTSVHLPKPPALGDLWQPIALLAAMSTNLPLVMRDVTSARARSELGAVQEILAYWHPSLQKVPVSGPVSRRRSRATPGTALCFTGGVDSFSSLVAHRNEVDTLLYVHGFDLPFAPDSLVAEVGAHLRDVAATWGCRLVEVTSNVRLLLDEVADWGFIAHGPALVSTSALLSGSTGRLLIPSTRDYLDLRPWGSHPMLDRLWSTDQMTVVHDGADRRRSQKVETIVDEPGVLDHLRVCWETTGPLNCSVCAKCVRTMTVLEILGRLDKAATFRGPLDLDVLRAVRVRQGLGLTYLLDNLALARSHGRVDIADAIQESLDASAALPDDGA